MIRINEWIEVDEDDVLDRVVGDDVYGIIIHDEEPEDPRNYDNLGKMVCCHRRYNLGDKHNLNVNDFNGWDEVEEYLREEYGAAVMLPLYLYDHIGITMKTTSFSSVFDSCQVGFIYATEEDIKKEFGEITEDTIESTKKVLKGEVEMYDKYLIGDVYRVLILKDEICNLGHTHTKLVEDVRDIFDFEEAKMIMAELLKC